MDGNIEIFIFTLDKIRYYFYIYSQMLLFSPLNAAFELNTPFLTARAVAWHLPSNPITRGYL